MAFAAVSLDWSFLSQDAHTFTNRGWDRHKTRGCICDPEYGDIDCSKRMCPYGTDIMDQRNNLNKQGQYEVQTILFQARGSTADVGSINGFTTETFALTFKSQLNETFTTNPIVFHVSTGDNLHDFVLDVEQALESLPNRVIDDVKVNAAILKTTVSATDYVNILRLNITFSGEHVQGPQNLLTVRAYKCGDGCTPKLTGLQLEPNRQAVSVGFVNRWGTTIAVNGGTWYDSLKGTMNIPGGASYTLSSSNPRDNNNVGLAMSDFNSYECGRRGKCDYSTGICGCFAGYTGISCGTITALV